jgi:opacity protein-like surface antigen
VGSSLYAGNLDANSKGFLGLEVGAGFLDGDRSNGFKHQGSAIEYGLRLGSKSDEWRATFAFDYFNSNKDDQKIEKSYLLIDYLLFTNDSGLNINPYLGLNVGYMNYESTLVNATGLIYGGQAGIIWGASENIDLDLSYRYSLAKNIAVNNSSGIIFGFNYLY